MVPKCPINAQIPYYCSIEGKDRFMFSKLLLLSIEPVFFFQLYGTTHMVSFVNRCEVTCCSRKLLPKW